MPYVPHTPDDVTAMLEVLGKDRLDELFGAIPREVQLKRPLRIPERRDEAGILAEFSRLATKNMRTDDRPSFLGAGAYRRFIPAAVDALSSRGEFNTAYTPYQPEVSQGTLQAIFEYQTLIARLTGMEIANASMYEGATAVVEAIFMASAIRSGGRKPAADRKECVLVSEGLHPEHLETLETYLAYQPMSMQRVPLRGGITDERFIRTFLAEHPDTAVHAVVFQSPNFFGAIEDGQALRAAADSSSERPFLVASVDPVALALLAPPGTYDADIAVGDGQALGSPLNFGGPSFGFFATRQCHVRKIPGRVVGETTDRQGRRGYVLTFQTREQHIRRERATSNICTNQGLCSLRAAMYLTLLGEHGLRSVAEASLRLAHFAHERLSCVPGVEVPRETPFFQEFPIRLPLDAEIAYEQLAAAGIIGGLPLGRYFSERSTEMLVACTEMTQRADIEKLATALAGICATETRSTPAVTTGELEAAASAENAAT